MIKEKFNHSPRILQTKNSSRKIKKFKFSFTNRKYSEILSKIKMEANLTKYIVSKLNALGICDEELDENSLENFLKVLRNVKKVWIKFFKQGLKVEISPFANSC